MRKAYSMMGTVIAVVMILTLGIARADHQAGGASGPCCQEATTGPFVGKSCDESFGGGFTLTPPPSGGFVGGCYENDATGSCIGGGLIADTDGTAFFNGCICLRKSGKKFECFAVDKITQGGVAAKKCNQAAVAGCVGVDKAH